MSPVLIGFIFYLIVVLVAGGLTYRMNKTQEDFLLAGRRLNVWVATFSERASGESAWLLLGLPAAAMGMGLVEGWTAIGCVVGIGVSWFVIAKKLRVETERYEALTLPEYFSARFTRYAVPIRLVATFIIVFFYAFYVAAQFNGAGKVLNVTFSIPHVWGIGIGAVVIVLYTMMGGFFAVAWTDLIQAGIMLCTLIVLPLVGLAEIADRGTSLSAAMSASDTLSSWTGGKEGLVALAAVVGGLSWGFGYTGQPHTVTRFMSMRRADDVRRARIVALAWAIPAFIGALAIGFVGLTLYEKGTLADPEQLLPHMATDLLPGWLAGIFISGAIAAMMSTADSQLLVGTSAIAEDFMRRTLKIELSPQGLVKLSRIVTICLGAAGFILALVSEKLIFALVSYAWSGLGSSFGPALILTLHWRRTTGRGVLAGMITGALSTIVWSNIDALNEVVSVRLVSFVLATIAVVIGSLSQSSQDDGRNS